MNNFKAKNINSSRAILCVLAVLLCIASIVSFLPNTNYVEANMKNQSATELFFSAVYKLESSKNVTCKFEADLKVLGTQKVYATKMFDGTTHFNENHLNGIKNYASRIYCKNGSDAVTSIKGTDISKGKANFNGKVTHYTLKEYADKFGISPNSFMPYVISSATISSASDVKHLSNGGAKFTITLHPQMATKNYAKNLKELSGLSEPNFKSIVLTIELSPDGNFKKVENVEEFSMKVMGLSKNVVLDGVTTFDFDTKVSFPAM